MKIRISFIGCCLVFVSINSCKKSVAPVLPPSVISPIVNDPTIASISPATGPKGTLVEISGTHFGTDTSKVKVSFNGTDATVISMSDTKLHATVPARSGTSTTSTVNVTILTKTVIGPVFTYVTKIVVSALAGLSTTGYVDGDVSVARFISGYGTCIDGNGGQ